MPIYPLDRLHRSTDLKAATTMTVMGLAAGHRHAGGVFGSLFYGWLASH